jgi:diguanylate cyclase (GGDEF)-like protein
VEFWYSFPKFSDMNSSTTSDLSNDQTHQAFFDQVDQINERAYGFLRHEQLEEARKLAAEAYTLSTSRPSDQAHYVRGIAASLTVTGNIELKSGAYEKALNLFLQGLKYLDQTDYPTFRALIYDGLSWIYYNNGDFSAARSYNQRALEICETEDLPIVLSQVLSTSGAIHYEFNEFEDAVNDIERCIPIINKQNNLSSEAIAYNNLALLFLSMNKLSEAEAASQSSLKLIRMEHYPTRETHILDTLGMIEQQQGRLEQACEYFKHSIEVIQAFDDTPLSIEPHMHLGRVLFEMGSLQAAIDHLLFALKVATEHNIFRFIYTCHEQLSACYEQSGNLQAALDHHRLFHQTKEKIFNQEAIRRATNLTNIHKIETAQKDAEILRLRNSLLIQEIEQAKLRHSELEYQAATDSLTGLFNRRHFMEISNDVFASARANLLPLSIILLDIDHFKLVNDKFGHLTGDKVLVKLSEVLNTSFRLGDLCCRYGGEEFVVLLPNTDLETGLAIAERVLRHISEMQLSSGTDFFNITISAGVASREKRETNLMSLLDRADKALYQAKTMGRNRVMS